MIGSIFKIKNIIYFFITINIFLFFFGFYKGFSKQIPNLSLKEIFSENIHSPFYFILLTLFQEILNFFNLSQSDDLLYLRLTNIIGLVPLYYSFKLLKKNFSEINLEVVFLLLISSHFFFITL